MDFTLWLEFEEVDLKSWDKDNDFANIRIELNDGRAYGLNVWTFQFIETCRAELQESGENLGGIFMKPPDLLVQELTRDCIEKTVEQLLKEGNLEDTLNPSIVAE